MPEQVVVQICEICQYAAPSTKCFDCSNEDENWKFKCHECDKCTDGSEIVDEVELPVCFACYWRKLNLQFQKDVITGVKK